MVKSTRPINANGNEQRFRVEDMNDGKTLDSDRFVTLFEEQGDTNTAYGLGHGPSNRDYAKGWSDYDLQVDDGTGTIEPAQGKYRWEIYRDAAKEELVAKSATFSAGDLRSAVAADRTQKRNIPAEQPLAGNDSFVVLAFRAAPAQDGYTVSAADSNDDLGIAYTEYK